MRGYRIELGEIEAALLDHAAVRECVVLALAKEHGNKQLVAYVIRGRNSERVAQLSGSEAAGLHGAGKFCVSGALSALCERES